MDNSKKRNLTLIISLIFIIGTGCENFLSHNDPSNLDTDNFFRDASSAEAIVNSVYQSLYPMYTSQAWLITELRTGATNTFFTGDAGFPDFRDSRLLQMTSDHPSLQVIWQSHYRGIANANLAILEIPEIQMDEGLKSRLLGEVRFLRAYYYFNLVRIFGEVPLITQPVDLGSADLHPSNASIENIYDLIVEDLIFAENAGLPFNDETGSVTTGAIKSLLSSVYISMAGFPLEYGVEYYELAKDKAQEVINSQEYSLFDSYDAFRDESRDNTGEHIFMVQFHPTEQPFNSLQSAMIPYRLDISRYSFEAGMIFAENEFVESYESGDKRTNEGEFFFTEYSLAADRSVTVDFGGYYFYKFFNENAHLNTAYSGLNWQIIRYSDVLLNYAEASNEVLGPNSDSYEAINKIRRRADVPEYTELTQSEFREAIWRERWHEQIFEGELWFKMLRTRKVFNIIDGSFNDFIGHSFVTGETLGERELVFPIPTSEIRNNENLVQNPGY